MRKTRSALTLGVVVVILALLATWAWAAKIRPDAARYTGVSEEEAFDYLIGLARISAEDGSWENIAIARTYMLADRVDEGQAIIDNMKGQREASDFLRMGRAYYLIGDWAKTEAAFEEVLARKPKDADKLAEIGAYFNVHGDRQRAEELFARSFELAPADDRNLRNAAGSYLGVVPSR